MDKETIVAVLIRMPPALREALGEAARANRRSVTAEIVRRLEQSVRADERRERRRKSE